MTIKTHGRMVTDNSISIAQLNVTDGSDGQVLATDGSGTMSFESTSVLVIENNSVTGAKIAMGSDVAGDVLYYNGTDYQRLGIGTSGQHLATNSGATAPEWATPIAATTTASGTVEIATQAEVITGTDTARSITPATLEGRTATTTATGLVEIATQAEVTTGTDTARSITPATLEGRLNASIAQGDLKTTTATNVKTPAALQTTFPTVVTLTGGQFILSFEFIHANPGQVGSYTFSQQTDTVSMRIGSLSYNLSSTTAYRVLALMQNYDGGGQSQGNMTGRHTYIQASPPYDIGDGHCHSFLYLMIENGTGKITDASLAPDPVWAYNGPTSVRPEYKRNGKRYKKVVTFDKTKEFADPDRRIITEQEVTAGFKNADMALIPHPFQGNDLTGKSIVMIDPCDEIARIAQQMQEDDENPLIQLFFDDYVRFGNEHIKGRCTPCDHGVNEVMVVKPTWKNSK